MSLTPIDYTVITSEETTQQTQTVLPPSRTWRIDLDNGRISGQIDGESAIRQYIRKTLMTARNRFLIYDEQYGEEISGVIGQNATQSLLDVEIPRLIREALIYDDRIADIPTVEIERYNTDSIHIRITVVTVNGIFITEEVTI